MDTNTNFANCGADAAAVTSGRTDAVIATRAITETLVDDVLEKCFQSGGEPEILMVGGVSIARRTTLLSHYRLLDSADRVSQVEERRRSIYGLALKQLTNSVSTIRNVNDYILNEGETR